MIQNFQLKACCLALLTTAIAHGETGTPPQKEQDVLSLLNGDFLHGHLLGINPSGALRWHHPDIEEGIEIQTNKIRRIALSGGKPNINPPSYSYVRFENGDQIPGEIIAMDQEVVHLATSFAGELMIPRSSLSQLAPSPYGGKIHYYGPFSEDRWSILNEQEPETSLPEDVEAQEEQEQEEKEEEDPLPPEEVEDEETPREHPEDEKRSWNLSGTAWYNSDSTPLFLDADLPDKALISCHISWKNRLSASIAFHATLPSPEVIDEKTKEGRRKPRVRRVAEDQPVPQRARGLQSGTQGYPSTYGESYVLTLFPSNYVQLHRCSFDEEGNPVSTRLTSSNSHIRIDDTGETAIEIRCDRSESLISLYMNGKFAAQWIDPAGYAGTGSHVAFASTNESSRLRISDIVVSSWNGMFDSAVSMDSKERDIVLLTNGTDRFSGSVTSIQDGTLTLLGSFAEMKIPLDEVQEIRFAKKDIIEQPSLDGNPVRLLMQPVGKLTLSLLEINESFLEGTLPSEIPLKAQLDSIDVIEFSYGETARDSWDHQF